MKRHAQLQTHRPLTGSRKDARLLSQTKRTRGRRWPDHLASVFETEIVPMLNTGVPLVRIFEAMLRPS